MDEFENKLNWTGGPTFDLILISEALIDGNALHHYLLHSGKFTLYSGSPAEKRMRTLFEVTPGIRLAMEHSFYRSTHRIHFSYYSIFIRPKVFEKFVGAQSEEQVRFVEDPTNLAILVDAFSELTFSIKTQFLVDFATIADENEGHGNPHWRNDLKGLYVSGPICDVLQIPSMKLERSCLDFVCSFIDN